MCNVCMSWFPNKLSNLQSKPMQPPKRRYINIVALHSRWHYIPTSMLPNVYGLLLISNESECYIYIHSKEGDRRWRQLVTSVTNRIHIKMMVFFVVHDIFSFTRENSNIKTYDKGEEEPFLFQYLSWNMAFFLSIHTYMHIFQKSNAS